MPYIGAVYRFRLLYFLYSMKLHHAVVAALLLLFTALIGVLAYMGGVPLLFPAGAVGVAERNLMVTTVFLMLIVVVPVYILIVLIASRYRAKNAEATYTPDWEHSKMEELIWWAIPLEIVLVLGALTWSATHELHPENNLVAAEPEVVVQVVALPWKWLFIYPEEGVASTNELVLPAGRPVEFQITADAPMNSFWIPALGGQIYAMSGMVTKLHLIADEEGTYWGRSANYSGEGFADMTFPVRAMGEEDYQIWLGQVRASSRALDEDEYIALATPGPAGPVQYYSTVVMPFDDIVTRSMVHPAGPSSPTH
jgi:cytochrome o ubiquinol oxidase subunit II